MKKQGFWVKLKVFYYWMFKHGNGIIVHCNYCNSTKLTIVSNSQDGDNYNSEYKCRKCGAIAKNTEVWSK
jgi:hypothetical protein